MSIHDTHYVTASTFGDWINKYDNQIPKRNENTLTICLPKKQFDAYQKLTK